MKTEGTVTGQLSESFSGRLISTDETFVPMRFAIPSAVERGNAQGGTRLGHSGEPAGTGDTGTKTQ